jgi:hypothetical protein
MKMRFTPLAAVPALFVSLALAASPVQAGNDARDTRGTKGPTENTRLNDQTRQKDNTRTRGDTTRAADSLRNSPGDDKTTVPANRMPRDSTADTSYIPVRPGF